MNKETQRIKHALKMIYNGSPWHGASLLHLLKGVDYLQASQRPVSGGHTIWELVQHILNWREFAIKKMEGETDFDITLNSSDDWVYSQAPIEAQWQNLLSELVASQQTILEILESWFDEQLDEKVPGKDYTFYTLLQGIMDHDIYHAGQLALVRKALNVKII